MLCVKFLCWNICIVLDRVQKIENMLSDLLCMLKIFCVFKFVVKGYYETF